MTPLLPDLSPPSTPLPGEVYDRSGNEMRDSGLYVDLEPWGYHVFALGS
jgi:hypothetical protein